MPQIVVIHHYFLKCYISDIYNRKAVNIKLINFFEFHGFRYWFYLLLHTGLYGMKDVVTSMSARH